MNGCFGGKEFEYLDNVGNERRVKIGDEELYRALRQLQTFEYSHGERAEKVAVVVSKKEWIETLNQLKCTPAEYWFSSQHSGNELYTNIQSSNLDGVMTIMNGSKAEKAKIEEIEDACDHFGVHYLERPQEELVDKKGTRDMDGIIDWLEETRKNQPGV